jgi:hypothetical protein
MQNWVRLGRLQSVQPPLDDAADHRRGRVAGAVVAGFVWVTMGSLGAWRGSVTTGALSGATAGLIFTGIGWVVAALGYPQLCGPAPAAFFAYWWIASGAIMGCLVGFFGLGRGSRVRTHRLVGRGVGLSATLLAKTGRVLRLLVDRDGHAHRVRSIEAEVEEALAHQGARYWVGKAVSNEVKLQIER